MRLRRLPDGRVAFEKELLLVPVVPAPSRTTRALRVLRRYSPTLAVALALVLLHAHDHAPLLAVLLAGQESEGASSNLQQLQEKGRCFQVEAAKSGTVEELKFHTTTGTNTAKKVQFAILADSAGAPGSVLQEKEKVETVAENALYSMTGFSVTVEAGKKYWLAVNGLEGTITYKKGAGAGTRKATANIKKISEATWGENENSAPIFFAALGAEGAAVKLVPAERTASTSASMAAFVEPKLTPAAVSATTSRSASIAAEAQVAGEAKAVTTTAATLVSTGQLAGTASASTSATAQLVVEIFVMPVTASATTSREATITASGAAVFLVPQAAVMASVTTGTGAFSSTSIVIPAERTASTSSSAALGGPASFIPNESRASTSRSVVLSVFGLAGAEPPTQAKIVSYVTSARITNTVSSSTVIAYGSSSKITPAPTGAVLSGG